MPNRTPNYNLVKPLQTENYNVDDFNGNMDIVDTQIKDKDTRIKTLEDNKPIVSAKLINLEDRIKVNEQDLTIIKNDLYVNKDLTNVKNSNVINQLTNSKNGMINGLTLQGKTMYKRANGTVTDTWESGVTLLSAGEDNQNKIDILSTSTTKNRFDKDSVFVNKGIQNSDGAIIDANNNIISNYCLVESNTTYKKINVEYGTIWFYDEKKRYVSFLSVNGETTFTTPTNCRFLIMNLTSVNNIGTLSTIMLIKSTESDVYELYKGDKTEILTTQPLRQWDSIDSNGVVNRGSGQVVLNGSENWQLANTGSTTAITFFTRITDYKGFARDNLKNNKLPVKFDINNECLFGEIMESQTLYITKLKSNLTTQDFAGFKTWLSQNPVTVVYQLATPTTENTNKTLNLSCYENGFLVVNSGLVNPEINFNYPTSIYGSIFTIADGIGNIRENIEKTFTPKEDTGLLATLVGQVVDTSVKIAQVQNVNATLIKELTDTKIEIVNLKTELSLK